MFVVISNVVGQKIQWPVVTVRLLIESIPEVVFCDEMSGARVEAPRKERRENKVYKCPMTSVDHDEVIKKELDQDVFDVP